jgi:hypothetical protein
MKAGAGLGLGLDEEHEGDQVITADGEKILLVAPSVVEALGEATIATQETSEGQRLVVSR